MKKIIAILALLIPAATGSLSAQPFVNKTASYLSVAYGTPTSGGNSASYLNYIQLPLSDTFGSVCDTVTLNPYARVTQATILINDSADVYIRNVAGCFYGDELVLNISNPDTCTGVLYLSGFVIPSGTNAIPLTQHDHCLVRLYFDGYEWVQYAGILNYYEHP